ncbi:MAG TPA: hypothetical protein VJ813_18100, partial [Vicinamibacterales bacterium]|nr:hypothetical protein [Vicinamibacterales bacterium]
SAAPAPVPEGVATAQTALAGLARLRPSAPFRARAIALQGDAATIWVAGELSAPAATAGAAEISVSAGGTTESATAALAAGQRGFVVPLPLKRRLTEPVDVRVRIAQPPGLPPLTDMIRVDAGAGLAHPLLFRRGPSTGNRVEPVAEPSFSRTERARFDLPGAAVKLTAARILDRNGAPIELPITLSERTDAGGQRWSTAEVILAALAPGDYIIELSDAGGGAEQKVLTAFRVTR